MDKKKGRVPLFLLIRANLRMQAALPSYVLRIVVDINLQTGIGAEFTNERRHEHFIVLVIA